ncbi:tetraacyldisaccharide 4'-kinase [Mesonia ostreae]|uniref:Tetraacyldisaccharide 4'-kinase n=1 Tax=Mesonia ostreae TaxID=861110 RepID=A0ABU2KL47_9FLAO|nr:tetraacyldisaccharide 4'-kinase [Mesonia ostreae]MDT0295388.1 tetraacyldisaccharide 4'-kinase [Mesonia ostreae]
MQLLRKLLFPFSILYGIIVGLRNKFFDWGFLTSTSYNFPVITVGNLSMGGTGKSPMIEYLIDLLKPDHQVGTLSRGYKRKTKGFLLLDVKNEAKDVGDEPLQFKRKFPEVFVAVDENRQHGISELRAQRTPPKVILLDDAYQHRKVKAGFSILLTAYHELYSNDIVLPAGNLREPAFGANRADVVIVTKCPLTISEEEKIKITKSLKIKAHQKLFFTGIHYEDYFTNGVQRIPIQLMEKFNLVTGIAKPKPLVHHLKANGLDVKHYSYPDHHLFTEKELETLRKEPLLVTTEKDFMRLKDHFPREKLFYLPIKTVFLENKKEFDQEIKHFVGRA